MGYISRVSRARNEWFWCSLAIHHIQRERKYYFSNQKSCERGRRMKWGRWLGHHSEERWKWITSRVDDRFSLSHTYMEHAEKRGFFDDGKTPNCLVFLSSKFSFHVLLMAQLLPIIFLFLLCVFVCWNNMKFFEEWNNNFSLTKKHIICMSYYSRSLLCCWGFDSISQFHNFTISW